MISNAPSLEGNIERLQKSSQKYSPENNHLNICAQTGIVYDTHTMDLCDNVKTQRISDKERYCRLRFVAADL